MQALFIVHARVGPLEFSCSRVKPTYLASLLIKHRIDLEANLHNVIFGLSYSYGKAFMVMVAIWFAKAFGSFH